ncbi:unnamed protein product, partial [Mycena citricolor]
MNQKVAHLICFERVLTLAEDRGKALHDQVWLFASEFVCSRRSRDSRAALTFHRVAHGCTSYINCYVSHRRS